MNKAYRTHLHCLSFDVTRRCNLNCEWCLKGESENVDITKEIVDRTFDKTSDYCIHSISIFGGEPLLRPDMIIYIINQIIKRRIMTGTLILYTNGLIQNIEVKEALERFSEYTKSIEKDFCELCGIPLSVVEKAEKVKVLVGHRFHGTSADKVESALSFYSNSSKTIISLKEEDEPRMGGILLGGKAKTNYKNLISNPVNPDFVKMNYEECYIINNFNYSKFYGKFYYDNYIRIVISIASNGNVYPGTRYSYEEMDESPIFNIMDCTDFYEDILKWCWLHPVNSMIRELRKRKMLWEWCNEHDYKILDFTEDEAKEMLAFNKIADEQERRAKEIHSQFPELKLCQVDLLASLDMLISLRRLNASQSQIKSFLKQCTYFDSNNVMFMDIEWAKLMTHLILGEMDGSLSFEEIVSLMVSSPQYTKEETIQFIIKQGYSYVQAINIYEGVTNNQKVAQYISNI